MKIFILNHCAHNKGDNSVLYYLMNCINVATNNEAEVSVSSSDGKAPFWSPNEVSATYWPGGKLFKSPTDGVIKKILTKINSVLMRRCLYYIFIYLYSKKIDALAKPLSAIFGLSFIKKINEADYVFCTGGHHISNVLEKNCINAQLVALAMSHIHGKQPILWSQSIGPFDGAPAHTKNAMSRIFESCKGIFVRDELSVNCVESISKASITSAPDSVFLAGEDEHDITAEENFILCAVYTAGIKDEKYLSKYKSSWRKVALTLAQHGFEIKFIPMQYKGCSGDERQFLAGLVKDCNDKNISYIDEDFSPKETIDIFRKAKCIVGHKTHSVIYGLSLGKPTIAIAYHEKTKHFMSLFGFDSYVFPDVVDHELEVALKAIDAIDNNNQSKARKQSSSFARELKNNMANIMGA